MKFEEFQASRRHVDDVQRAIGCSSYEKPYAGYVYADDLYIFDDERGGYLLSIGATEWHDRDLTYLEKTLYLWARREGIFDPPPAA